MSAITIDVFERVADVVGKDYAFQHCVSLFSKIFPKALSTKFLEKPECFVNV